MDSEPKMDEAELKQKIKEMKEQFKNMTSLGGDEKDERDDEEWDL